MMNMSDAVAQIFYEHAEKSGRAEMYREEAKRETALEMLKRGFDVEDIASILKMPFEWVQNLMN
jgi:SOS response regulatory protein OraA/RecX